MGHGRLHLDPTLLSTPCFWDWFPGVFFSSQVLIFFFSSIAYPPSLHRHLGFSSKVNTFSPPLPHVARQLVQFSLPTGFFFPNPLFQDTLRSPPMRLDLPHSLCLVVRHYFEENFLPPFPDLFCRLPQLFWFPFSFP